eukprot:TRINITY_DN9110_c0_g1_i1.p1 TRINITY_DN9110_c0_g1~~TRINITY_DN9110_c0_g1_i1.p1  ORF type:complete len:423 (+),score=28.22 TRINITY_DN9110_c0_g1_i1:267-1535(+)
MDKVGRTLVAQKDEALKLLRKSYLVSNPKTICFYNSLIDRILTDPELMTVSIEDILPNRGHGVFDTARFYNGKTYQLEEHLARLKRSSELARIELPMPIDVLKKKVHDTLACAFALSNQKDQLYIARYYLSGGLGSGYGLYPVPGKSLFYCAVFAKESAYTKSDRVGIKEFTIRDVPTKPALLANMKSTDYMLNVLAAMRSKEQGGHQGIQVDENGYIMELGAANVALVLRDGSFVTPPFDKILAGWTVSTALKHAQEVLVPKGLLKKAEFRLIKPEEVYEEAVEMMVLGGDTVLPVLEFDGRRIGDGRRGKVTEALQLFLERDALISGVDIPFDTYKDLIKSGDKQVLENKKSEFPKKGATSDNFCLKPTNALTQTETSSSDCEMERYLKQINLRSSMCNFLIEVVLVNDLDENFLVDDGE